MLPRLVTQPSKIHTDMRLNMPHRVIGNKVIRNKDTTHIRNVTLRFRPPMATDTNRGFILLNQITIKAIDYRHSPSSDLPKRIGRRRTMQARRIRIGTRTPIQIKLTTGNKLRSRKRIINSPQAINRVSKTT